MQWGIDPKKILKLRLEYNDDNHEILELDQTIVQPDSFKVELKKPISTNKLKFIIIETNKPDEEHMLLMKIYGTLCYSIKQLTQRGETSLTKLDKL